MTSFTWDTTTVSDGSNYVIKVIADDGQESSWDTSDGVFTINNLISSSEKSGSKVSPRMTAFAIILAFVILAPLSKWRNDV